MKMITEKSWSEFQSCGLLWFVNSILHLFGWAICIERDDDANSTRVYPARVKFRGFTDDINTKNYIKLSEYLKNTSNTLYNEATDNYEDDEKPDTDTITVEGDDNADIIDTSD